MKLAVIGGASSYTPELIDGIIKRKKELKFDEIVLMDLKSSKNKLNIIKDLAIRMFEKNNIDVKIDATFNRKEALKKADFIITQIRVGGLQARGRDEKIPLKYNLIGQETTGAGGFANALRTIPVILDICKDIEKYSKDNAFLINFTNPAGIITEAIKKHTNVKVIGLCNVPLGMKMNIAKMLSLDPKFIEIDYLGLNHLVYGKNVYYKGKNITKKVIDELINGGSNTMENIPDLNWDKNLLKSINMVPCPYHKYFYMTNKMLKEEKDKLKSLNKTRADEVKEIEKELFDEYKDKSLDKKPESLEKRGGAYYSDAAIELINSIYNNKNKVHTVNVYNKGAILNLDDNVVVEVNALVNKKGVFPIYSNKLPEEVSGLVKQVKAYEKLTIKAAVTGDKDKALQALYNNPLVYTFEKANLLLEDILEQNKNNLPRFF